jgi:hypothetical protein
MAANNEIAGAHDVASAGSEVEVICKVQDEEYLGNVTLESGREGLRCRFAWSTTMADFPVQSEQNKDVKCCCSSEVRKNLEPYHCLQSSSKEKKKKTASCNETLGNKTQLNHVRSNHVQAVEAATRVSLVLPTGEELICDPIKPKPGADTPSKPLKNPTIVCNVTITANAPLSYILQDKCS